MTHPACPLVLDEMFSPAIALALRDLGHDVVAVAERADLRSMTDDDLFAWSAAGHRWLLTENVKDFRPIMLRALQAGGTSAAGPDVFALDELGRITLAAHNDHRTVVTDNSAGLFAAASGDALIAKDGAVIAKTTYREWLAR